MDTRVAKALLVSVTGLAVAFVLLTAGRALERQQARKALADCRGQAWHRAIVSSDLRTGEELRAYMRPLAGDGPKRVRVYVQSAPPAGPPFVGEGDIMLRPQ